ncbi:YbhB/YbcL family Raf kinase inhibitor-like protein [Streptomyces mirabilis]|nr:YbhB/YbcL family Raf kinase inhibitor-like protein [Streptomyces mirabilis]
MARPSWSYWPRTRTPRPAPSCTGSCGRRPARDDAGCGRRPEGRRAGPQRLRQRRYGGPCPPAGKPHHYVFSVLAADVRLHLPGDATVDAVRRALAGHTVGSGTLVGRYGRTG